MSAVFAGPRELFLQRLARMLWVERMLAFEGLHDVSARVESESLVALLDEHRETTRTHVSRLEEVFRALGAEPVAARDAAAAAQQRQHGETLGSITDPRLADLYGAAAAMETERLEIASYEALLVLAPRDEARTMLERNRDEEVEMLDRLVEVAGRLGA